MSQERLDNKARALKALQAAGSHGIATEDLFKVAGLRFGARIFELRREGWEIETRARKGTELAKYILHGKVNPGQIGLFEQPQMEQGAC